nr:MAG TPA: hypothetical protein [Caudoviricetes sp.]
MKSELIKIIVYFMRQNRHYFFLFYLIYLICSHF